MSITSQNNLRTCYRN